MEKVKQITNIRNEEGDIFTDFTGIESSVRDIIDNFMSINSSWMKWTNFLQDRKCQSW